jgi:predicted CopG family antitoxin
MGTKTISLDDRAYELLKRHKRDDESFSEVVHRLAGERSWSEVAGIWSDEDDVADAVDDARAAGRDRADRLADDLDAALDS